MLKLRHLALVCSILMVVGVSVAFGQVDCTGVATWDPVVLYLAADHTHVVFQGRLYEAVVDSRVAQPQPGGNTWWRDLGACGGSPPPPPPVGVQIAGAWTAGTTHAVQAGSNRALIFTAHAEHNGTLSLNSVTYGGRSMTKIIERSASSAGSPTIADTAAFILNESGIAAATNGTFVVTWSITPTQPPAFSSVFLINVNQSALLRASASGVSNSATATTAALATVSGDRVIVAATNGNTGLYTMNNGFTEALEVAPGSADGVTGSKAATGANETPSVTHSAVNRQSVVGFVVRGATGGGGGDTQAPTAPTNLRVTAITASSVSLAWDASTDNVGVTGYDVFQGTLAGGTTMTSFMVNGLNCDTPFVFTVKAKDAAGNVSVSSSSVSATTLDCVIVNPGPRIYAPYADVGLFPTFNMTQTANATGVKFFTMAFINSRGCEATWFGILSLSDPFATERGNDINSLRALGGDAIISFGGASGAELAEVCGSASATQAQYQRVITMYGLKRVDFDIEGAAVASPVSVDIRNQAIAGLQRMNPGLVVSYTLPVLPTGLTQDGINLLKNAVQNGVNLTTLNLMTFDYGASFQGASADLHIQAINSTADQLGQAGLLPQLSQAQRRAMMSITIMNGNDDQGRVTSLLDAQQVLTAARAENWKGIRMWGIHRDHPCTGGSNLTCSGIPQGDFAFSNIFKVFP